MTEPTILDAIRVYWPELLGESWRPWRCVLRLIYGLPPGPGDLELFTAATGRTTWPTSGFQESALIVGRRGGKSRIMGLIAAFEALYGSHEQRLAPGELGSIVIVAGDKAQGRSIAGYCRAFLASAGIDPADLETDRAERIALPGGRIEVEVVACSFRGIRSRTVVCAMADELAYWRDEATGSLNPAEEVLAALRPAMATVPDAKLILASSPYRRSGPLFDAHRRHHGVDGADTLVWVAATRAMNAAVPQSFIEAELRRDPVRASSEYLATFRADSSAFLPAELVDELTDREVTAREPVPGVTYVAGVDPSGGTGVDEMTLCIAHREGDGLAVVDLVLGFAPPFVPGEVVAAMAAALARYRVRSVVGDRYAGAWPVESFAEHDIRYVHATRTRSECYIEALPWLSGRAVRLIDDPVLARQLSGLERRPGTGRDSVDHARGQHDDRANVMALAILAAMEDGPPIDFAKDLILGAPLESASGFGFADPDPHLFRRTSHRRTPGAIVPPIICSIPSYRSAFDGPDPADGPIWADW